MKRFNFLLALLSVGILTAPKFSPATPVSENTIPQGVDWFVHLDADQLRETRSGQAFIREFRKIIPTDSEEMQQLPIDPVLILNGIRGLTVFGDMPDMKSDNPEEVEAVVLIEGTPDLIQVFRGLISGMQLEKPEAITTTKVGEASVLSLKEEGIHGCFVGETRIAIGKSLPALSEFLVVNATGLNHVSFEKRFPTYHLGDGSGIFFGAFVEGLGVVDDLPAQARILKLTQSVSVQLGEAGESVNLLASLVTDSAQTSQQVQEVLQGILALFLITQNGQADVAALVNSARVNRVGNAVSLNLAYPVARVEDWAVVLAELARQEIIDAQQEPDAADQPEPETETGTGA